MSSSSQLINRPVSKAFPECVVGKGVFLARDMSQKDAVRELLANTHVELGEFMDRRCSPHAVAPGIEAPKGMCEPVVEGPRVATHEVEMTA